MIAEFAMMNPTGSQTLLQEGQAALERGAWEHAVAVLAEAASEDPAEPTTWETLGMAHTWVQAVDRAIEARERAYALYRERGDDLSSARVSLELVWDYLEVRGEPAVANGWFQRARRLLENLPQGGEHALLRIWDAYLSDDPTLTAMHAGEAATIAGRVGARDAEVLALAIQGVARVSVGSIPDGMSLLDEAMAGVLGREISDPQWYYLTCCCMIDACDMVRDFERSLAWCDRLRAFAERWRVQAFLTGCRVKYSGSLLWRGEWTACEAELTHAIEELSDVRRGALPAARVRLAELRRRQGRPREAEEMLEDANTHPLAPLVRAGLALDAGDPDGAVDHLDQCLRRIAVAARTERVAGLELMVRAQAGLGNIEKAREAAAELATIAAEVGTDALRGASFMAEGVVAAAASDHATARRCFEDAAYLLEAAGSPYESARARTDLAASLAALGRDAAAVTEATSARVALEGIGAVVEARRATTVLGRLCGPTENRDDVAGTGPGGGQKLTRRQREVLSLIAQGMSDREIAGRLFLSEHTVHRHVANVFDRLDVTSRSAAVAQAIRLGLL